MKRPAGSSRHSLRVAFLALVVFAQPTRADDASDRRDLIRSIENEDSRWRDADGIKRDMDQWRDYARRFGETDGKWSNVRSELHTSADEVYGEWNKSWKLAEQQCANLRRGTDHPKIDAAMRELARFSKGREEIIKEAEGYLDAAASLLSGADRHSDDRNIAAALLKGDDIGRSLAKLGYAKGADKRANDIVERWPRYVEAYKFAATQLLELKRWQFTLDSAVGTCEARESTLRDEIAKYKDATGIPVLENTSRSLQQQTTASLEKAREHHRKMEQWNGNAQKLSLSEGKWSYVSGYLRSSARGSFEYWKNALEKAERACADLARGIDHPKVREAIKTLTGRIPPPARHSNRHDSTCAGVPAGGFAWPTTSAWTAAARATSACSAPRATTADVIRPEPAARLTTTRAAATRSAPAASRSTRTRTAAIRRSTAERSASSATTPRRASARARSCSSAFAAATPATWKS
jgi:hypothetical protein